MLKRIFALILSLCLLSALPVGSVFAASDDRDIQVVTTIFPIYDWVMNLAGDVPGIDVSMLLDSRVDLHSFQPTVDDIVKVSSCDLFIYVGGESDDWVDGALKESVNPDMIVIDLLSLLGNSVKEEEIVEGMVHVHDHDHEEHEHEEDHDHDHEHEEDHDHEEEHDHEAEYDEHVWLSLRNARICCDAIADALARLDPDNAGSYQASCDAYTGALSSLDKEYQAAVDASEKKAVLFGDRFPFRYLTDDYGLRYYAAFTGCSAETEASFETIVFLAGKVDELGLNTILQIENSKGTIAQTIRSSTKSGDQQILTMNSMQSVEPKDIEKGASYLSIMEENLKVLKTALQ